MKLANELDHSPQLGLAFRFSECKLRDLTFKSELDQAEGRKETYESDYGWISPRGVLVVIETRRCRSWVA